MSGDSDGRIAAATPPTAGSTNPLTAGAPVDGNGTPTAVQRVYAHVREGVLDGELAEGTMLSENQVAAALGVSRTPVREAFVQLQSQGFLRLYPRRGALVVPVSQAEIHAVLETRWAVERHAIERLVNSQDQAALAAMRTAIGAQAGQLAAGDLAAFSATDRDFHRAFVVATANHILLELYDTLRDRQRRMVQGAISADPTIAAEILDEHREIVDTVEAGDAAKASRLLLAHLERARRTLVD